MSHRQRINAQKKSMKQPKMPAQIPPILPGPFTAETGVQMIGEIEHAAKDLHKGIETDTYEMMHKLDTDKEILKKLDKNAVNSIPIERRGNAFRAFHAALWTWLARKKGLLDPILDMGLIKLGMEPFGKFIPAIAPISDDVPTFNQAFLCMLQDCIKCEMIDIDFLPERHHDKDICVPGSEKTKYDITAMEERKRCIPLEGYYDITRQALESFFELKLDGQEEMPQIMAEKYVPYVFIWLGTFRLLQDIVIRLVNGDPYIRKSIGPDGKMEITFAELKSPKTDQ